MQYGYEWDDVVPADQYLEAEDALELPGQLTIEDEYEAIDHDSVERAWRQRERVIDWMAFD